MNKIYKSRSKFYKLWVGVNRRVGKQKNYRNIIISDEWREFQAFFDDMFNSYCEHVNKYGEKHTTIERIDRNGNYCKENCVWATQKVQANNRSSNVYIFYNGETKSISDWARKLGISRQALAQRIEKGWSLDKIFSTPKKNGRRFLLQDILDGVMRGKFGTKNRSELISRLTDILTLF
ncbi:MAG: hypothetical protein NUV65_03510 [Candidatus Roizmanbacteria bacterium]|nr:hypothetical protein [Candidatus Roizmanbacteria bacterium]